MFLTNAEKVHFQHTAKFINHLISEKANYTPKPGKELAQETTEGGRMRRTGGDTETDVSRGEESF